VPVERLGFTLLLSLRFLPLVQEELQNLLRSIATRAVNARQLGRRGVLALALALAERLFRNVLLRSEQGAEALLARGAAPLHPSLLEPPGPVARWGNALGLVALILVLGMRWKVGGV
jgi:energy-coupling factor transport system permease protein